MDLEKIGYFLYMEEQERKQKQMKVNVEYNSDLVGEEPTTNGEKEKNIFLSRNYTPF